MIRRVTVHQAKSQLSRLLLDVSSGKIVEIARGGVPVARLVAVERAPVRRNPGKYKGKIKISDNFDEPLPVEMLKSFK